MMSAIYVVGDGHQGRCDHISPVLRWLRCMASCALCGSASCSRLDSTGSCPAMAWVTWPTTVSSSLTPVSDNCVLPTLEHSWSVGRAAVLETEDFCRRRITSLPPVSDYNIWAVILIRRVQAVTEDIFIRTVRPRRSVNWTVLFLLTYYMAIGTRMQPIEWCHFQLP